MCMAHERKCSCGSRSASFHFKDNVLPEQVVQALYCPACSSSVKKDEGTMVSDNGWLIRYDMEIARAAGASRIGGSITPAVVFDQGYCSWSGMYPGDTFDSVREREAITATAKTDPIGYLKKLKTWAQDRSVRLKSEGWRKAQDAA